jgi:hypothetical protein
MRSRSLLVAVSVLCLLLAGCGSDEPTTETGTAPGKTAEAEGTTVVITAKEYEFDLPDELPAGPTTFNLTNAGEEQHFIDIVPLAEGAPSVEKLIKLPDDKAESFFAGPPNHPFVAQ